MILKFTKSTLLTSLQIRTGMSLSRLKGSLRSEELSQALISINNILCKTPGHRFWRGGFNKNTKVSKIYLNAKQLHWQRLRTCLNNAQTRESFKIHGITHKRMLRLFWNVPIKTRVKIGKVSKCNIFLDLVNKGQKNQWTPQQTNHHWKLGLNHPIRRWEQSWTATTSKRNRTPTLRILTSTKRSLKRIVMSLTHPRHKIFKLENSSFLLKLYQINKKRWSERRVNLTYKLTLKKIKLIPVRGNLRSIKQSLRLVKRSLHALLQASSKMLRHLNLKILCRLMSWTILSLQTQLLSSMIMSLLHKVRMQTNLYLHLLLILSLHAPQLSSKTKPQNKLQPFHWSSI